MGAALELWFDFASTYSYLAAERVEHAAAAAGVTLIWRPFLLGPLFKAQQGLDDSPFNRHPVRAAYMWRDVARECARLSIPWTRPSSFPRNSVLAARVAQVALDEPWGPAFVRRVFRANFAEDRDIAARDTIVELLAAAGADPDAALARAVAPEHKDRLRRATEEATRRGVFGAPSFFVGDELFFGNERLDLALARAAGGMMRA
jgi:2-hydroxychromene-2-carboxylate isomerase